MAFFLPTLDGGGAERALLTVAAALCDAGDDVQVIVANATGALREDLPPGLSVVDLQCRRIRSTLPALIRQLRRDRPQCLISTLDHANILAVVATRLAGTATRPVVRVANTLSHASLDGSVQQRAMLRTVRHVYPRAAAVVAPSAAVADGLTRFAGISRESISILANPVIDNDFEQRRSVAIDDPWFGPDHPPVILGVGRLVRQKRFDLLIDAFDRARTQVEARLLILGDGPEHDALEQQVERLALTNSVRLPGFDPNPLRFMAAAEVVVSTSGHEGLPAVLIQALACDAKIVATNCPGGSADVLGHGAFGTLVPPGDADAFATAVTAAIRSPRRRNDPASWRPYTVDTAVEGYRQLVGALSTPAMSA